jgi:hypothetical protein
MERLAGAPAWNDSSQGLLPRGYKWIARTIERLDPERDYALIWKLTAGYYPNDLINNLGYALAMARITQNPYGSEVLLRRSGKAKDRQQQRANDTLAHNWRWMEFGPDHVEAQRSIERVNRIHEAFAKTTPEAFPDDDYIYTACISATLPEDIRRMAGLPGFNRKQRIAAHIFWRNLVMKMRGPGGYINVERFPKSFEDMRSFIREFDSRPWPDTETGRELAQYLIQQFSEAPFPKALRGMGRQMVLTFQEPRIRQLRGMGDPNPIAAWLIKRTFLLLGAFAEYVLPDPKLSVPERARAAGQTNGQHQNPHMVAAEEVPFAMDGRLSPTSPTAAPKQAARCPFH